MSQTTQQKWDDRQIKYAAFVARGKQDRLGEQLTDSDFAEIVGVDRTTLWRWTQLPDWGQLLFEQVQIELRRSLPVLAKGLAAKATGHNKFKNWDVPAANTVIKLMGIAEKHQVESTVDARVEANVTYQEKSEAELDEMLVESATP